MNLSEASAKLMAAVARATDAHPEGRIEISPKAEAGCVWEPVRSSRSGPTLSEARRRELGTAQLKLRLPLEVIAALKVGAAQAGVGLSEYVAGLVGKGVGG